MIFLSKEPATKCLLPTLAKVTISLKISIALYSYSFKVSMVTYEILLSFSYLWGLIFKSGNCEFSFEIYIVVIAFKINMEITRITIGDIAIS